MTVESDFGFVFARTQHGEQRAVATKGQWRGWVFGKHPDGQWVSLRKATDAEIEHAESSAASVSMLRKASITYQEFYELTKWRKP